MIACLTKQKPIVREMFDDVIEDYWRICSPRSQNFPLGLNKSSNISQSRISNDLLFLCHRKVPHDDDLEWCCSQGNISHGWPRQRQLGDGQKWSSFRNPKTFFIELRSFHHQVCFFNGSWCWIHINFAQLTCHMVHIFQPTKLSL